MPLRFRKLTQVSFSIIFSGQKKSNGGSNNPNRLSCNLNFKDESQHKDLESFNTKDSSDSKSHDSGIDSIEKPGKDNDNIHQSFYLKRHFRYSQEIHLWNNAVELDRYDFKSLQSLQINIFKATKCQNLHQNAFHLHPTFPLCLLKHEARRSIKVESKVKRKNLIINANRNHK